MRSVPFAIALVLVLGLSTSSPAAAPAAGGDEISIDVSMILFVDGVPVALTGTLTVRTEIVGHGKATHRKTWTRYEFVSEDGTIRGHGSTVTDQKSGPGATHTFSNYHLVFVRKGGGVVARYRVLTHYVFDANGRLVSVTTR